MPLRRLEQTLEGLRQSALETARLYEERARILRGPSRIDYQLNAKRWSALADQTADLQATLRAVALPSPPGPQTIATETPLGHANDRAHQLAADILVHLQAARIGLRLLHGWVDDSNDPELTSALRRIGVTLRAVSREAAQGPTRAAPSAAPSARTKDARADRAHLRSAYMSTDHMVRVGGWDRAWTWWCSCGASGIATAWATEREALAAADHHRAEAAADPAASSHNQ